MIFRAASTVLCRWPHIAANLRHYAQTVTVDPFCRIRMKCVSPITLRPFDLLANPAANQIRATLSKNQTELDIRVETPAGGDGQQIVKINEKLTKFIGHDEILLEVPVQVDLEIECSEDVSVSGIESDEIKVLSLTGIRTKNIKSEEIHLVSSGNIQCEGQILAKKLVIQAQQEGQISLDKVLGDSLSLQSDEGNISIESCYSQSSKVRTRSGDLNLKNVHRNCEVSVEEAASLTMTGFNGTLLVTMNGGHIDLQIAELHGESVILANNATDMNLKLGEEVTSSTYVHADVAAEKLHLDDHLEPVRGEKENGASTLNANGLPNKLFLQTEGTVRIKQQSWADSLFGGPQL